LSGVGTTAFRSRGNAHKHSDTDMAPYLRKKDNRRAIRFTLLVTGAQGTGKTSFVNSLLDQNILPHRFHYNSAEKNGNTIPKTITYSNLSTLNASEMMRSFDPATAHQEPGVAITETSVEIVDEDDSKILLTVIDTPGFGDNINNTICIEEVCNFLEQQFDFVLAEETKVRRNPRFEDTRVHACLYFIEPTGHGLRELDIESMARFSKYVNVIPVIGRADSFTVSELTNFKRNILQDIERFKIPIFQFQADEDETDPEIIEESRYLSRLQPFAIVTSDVEATVGDKKTRVRKYPWGVIDINDTTVSDFPILRSVLLGSQLQDLKDITHDFLYEAYRTEKLSSVADLKDDFADSTIGTNHQRGGIASNEPPSMSNLAEIAQSQSMAKFDISERNNGNVDDVTNALSKTTIDETDEDGLDGNENNEINHTQNTDIIDDDTSKAIHRESVYDAGVVSNASQSTLVKPPAIDRSVANSPQTSSHSNNGSFTGYHHSPQSQVDPKKLRKISETVPYILRHETLRTKQAKLEELERQSAIELAKRAEELERKAKELKLREAMLRERLEKSSRVQSYRSDDVSSINTARTNQTSASTHEVASVASSSTDRGN
jgi:septin 1 family protein